MITLEDFKKDLLKDPEYKKIVERKRKNIPHRIARMLDEARIIKNLTQEQLANKIGTKQSAIARLEQGKNMPSLRILDKIAKAFSSYLIPPKFAFMKEIEDSYDLPIEDTISTGVIAFYSENIKPLSEITALSLFTKTSNKILCPNKK